MRGELSAHHCGSIPDQLNRETSGQRQDPSPYIPRDKEAAPSPSTCRRMKRLIPRERVSVETTEATASCSVRDETGLLNKHHCRLAIRSASFKTHRRLTSNFEFFPSRNYKIISNLQNICINSLHIQKCNLQAKFSCNIFLQESNFDGTF